MGSVLSMAALVAAGSTVLPEVVKNAVPALLRKDLLLRPMVAA
jgi:hypothetical protein